MKEQYAGYVRAKSGLVLGGVKANRSVPFKTREEATAWLLQAIQVNKDAGCDVEGEVQTLWNGKVVERR